MLELLIYLFGNWLSMGAAAIVLHYYLVSGVTQSDPQYYSKMKKAKGNHYDFKYNYTHNSDNDILISKDLMTCLFLSSILRSYWSMSPPSLWCNEQPMVQTLAVLDIICTIGIWGAAVVLSTQWFWGSVVGRLRKGRGDDNQFSVDSHNSLEYDKIGDEYYNQGQLLNKRLTNINGTSTSLKSESENNINIKTHNHSDDNDRFCSYQSKQIFSWPKVTLAAFVTSFIMSQFLPSLATDDAWPAVSMAVIMNLVLDGFAILPQVMLITRSEENQNSLKPESHTAESQSEVTLRSTTKASNFLGLLCLSRVFRMLFWIVVKTSDASNNTALWTFVIPDTIHTIIMADYLYVWLKKIKKDLKPKLVDVYLGGVIDL